ncbi:amidohydrolase family protein [Falsiroseomonas sp.]|uniref:amidohydrolase family protein n=1 Tax=Falsiroseomonas sp. TaxID=2870721 RepID=UPI0035646FD2
MTDILIEHGTLITMDPARRVIEDGSVAIEAGRITDIGPAAELAARHPHPRKRIAAQNHAVLPGLIDAHTHAGHAMTRTAGGGNSKVWFDTVGRIYMRGTSVDFWRLDASMAATERLRFGTTTAIVLLGGGDSAMRCDEMQFVDAHMEAVRQVGVKEIVVVGHPRPPFPATYSTWQGGQESVASVPFTQFRDVCAEAVRKWHGGAEGRIRVALLSPVHHQFSDPAQAGALYACTREMRELSRQLGVLFHMDGHRNGSIAQLQRETGALGPDASLSHCVDLTEADIAALVETGAVVVHNPSANYSIRGRCPAPELIDAGVTVALGTDAPAPDRSADMFRNMWQCMHYQRTAKRDEQVMPAGKVLEMCTIDAAKGLGLDGEIGSLEVGKKADVITVDLFKPHIMPLQMPVYRVTCFVQGSDVANVIVDGRVVLEGGEVRTVDWRGVLQEVQVEAEAMLRRTGLGEQFELPPRFWGHTHY